MKFQNSYYIILVLLIGIMFSACEKDYHFKNDYQPQVPVLNCRFSADNVFKIYLTTDNHIDSNKLISIKDATINIFEDEVFFEKLTYQPHPSIQEFGYYVSNQKPRNGHVYKVIVNHPNYGQLEAIDTLQQAIQINSSMYSYTYSTDSNIIHRMQVEIKDPLDEMNTYAFYLNDSIRIKQAVNTDTQEFSYISNQIVRNFYGEKVNRYLNVPFVKDANFNGLNKKLSVTYLSNLYHINDLVISYSFSTIIRKVSNQYEAFEKSIDTYYKYDLSSYDEIPDIYSNVKGGRGIFCGYTQSTIFYRIK